MAPRFIAQRGERGVQLRRCMAGVDVLDPDAVTFEQFERNIDLPARGMVRDGPKDAGDCVGNPDMLGSECTIVVANNDPCRQPEHRRLGLAAIRLERRERRHRIVIQIEGMRLDQVEQRRDR